VSSSSFSPPLFPDSAHTEAEQEALRWLRFQRHFALRPERVRDALLEGHDPGTFALESNRAMATVQGNERDRRALRLLEALDAKILPLGSRLYPSLLAELPDAPGVLLVRGRVEALETSGVAIVGARAATRAARMKARELARDLAASGVTIVSGLARGIDAEAHRGAIEAGGRTIGVLAGGLDPVYPPEHRALAEEMAISGAVLSEMPLGTAPRRELFPLRNRIISGLCVGVIVIEARKRSGSLITVRHALSQGREVFVVPGAADGPFASGSNGLLREGARAVSSAGEVLEDLGGILGIARHEAASVEVLNEPSLSGLSGANPSEAAVLSRLSEGPANRDQLLRDTPLDVRVLADVLLDLSLSGRILEERDGRFHLRFSRTAAGTED